MSGILTVLPPGSCSPTFFTGIAVSTSLLNAINQTITQALGTTAAASTILGSLPTSDTGLAQGSYWNNGGVISQVQ